MAISDVSEANFEGEVLKSKTPVVVDIWAPWCGPCVKPETVILGDNKPIIEFVRGDYAFGLTGHNRVTQTFEKPYEGDVITIKAIGLLPIQATPDHPVLVSTSNSSDRINSLSEPYWIDAGKLIEKHKDSDGNYLVVPRLKGTIKLKTIELQQFTKDIKMTVAKGMPTEFPLNTDTAWLLGLYVAEGNNTEDAAVFNLGSKEIGLQKRVIAIGKQLGYSPCISKSGESAVKVAIKSRMLARAFPIWCGKLAINKKIPDFIIMHENNKLLEAFLEGYFAGDGTVIKNKIKGNSVKLARTVSKTLAAQLQLLYARLGKFLLIQFGKKGGPSMILGRRVMTHDIYTVYFSQSGKTQAKINPANILVPIRKIAREPYSGKVYNIETTDNTYLVSNAVVHNCRMYSPIVDEVSKDYEGKVKFVKVNADEAENVASKYNVQSIPTTLLIKGGKVAAMQVGAVPKETLKKWIDKNI